MRKCNFLFLLIFAITTNSCKAKDNIDKEVGIYESLLEIGVYPDTSISITFEDLDFDNIKEAVVYLTGDWCGSGGCTLVILKKMDGNWSVYSKIPTVRLPISILNDAHNNMRSLLVVESGGGTLVKSYRMIINKPDGNYQKAEFPSALNSGTLKILIPDNADYILLSELNN